MIPTRLRIVVTGVLLSGLVGAGLLGAQGRDTLETRVTITGAEITLNWSKKHPWDADLVARGVSLFAEYRTPQGRLGTECLQPARSGTAAAGARTGPGACYTGSAVARRDDRRVSFRLPESLLTEPAGPVCLVLRLPDNRVLPIRRASRTGDDTARFQVPDWSAAAAGRRRGLELERRRTALLEVIARQRAEVDQQTQANAARGWTSEGACDSIPAVAVTIERSRRPLASATDRDQVARQVCVIRLAAGTGEPRAAGPPTDIDDALDAVPVEMREVWQQIRGPQLRTLQSDWNRYGPEAGRFKARFPVPHFGSYTERLFVQSLAALLSVVAPTMPELSAEARARAVLGHLGARLEAYDRCVAEGEEQMDLNFREAQALEATLATAPVRLRDQAVQACRSGVGRRSSMEHRLKAYEAELITIEEALPESTEYRGPDRRRELNDVACTP